MHKIQNPQLEELDKELFDFNTYFGYFLNAPENKFGYLDIKNRLDILRKKASKINPQSRFDSLILENILHILEAQQKYSDHFSETNNIASKDDIINLVDLCCGDGFFLNLENVMKNRDEQNKVEWKLSLSYKDRGLNEIRSDSKQAYEKIEKLIPQIKDDIIQEGIKRGFIPEGYDFKIIEFPPGVNIRSSWNPTLKVMELGVNSFTCLQEEDILRINTSNVYRILFHEVLGHAAHQHNSENLPLNLRMAGHNYPGQIVNLPHLEGVSIDRDKLSIDYISKNLERLNIKEEELKTLELMLVSQIKSAIPTLYNSFLKEIKLFDPSFDIYSHIINLTGSKRKAKNFSTDWDNDMYAGGAIKESSYLAGQMLMKRTKQIIIDKFGQEFYDQNQPKIAHAMTRGVWSWKTYPKAVEYFLRENK